jgi:DNA-directed RNA polymerase subunit RPC12/RpoP
LDVPFGFVVAVLGFLGCFAFLSTGDLRLICWSSVRGRLIMRHRVQPVGAALLPSPACPGLARRPARPYRWDVKIGEVAVCSACLRTRFERAELAAKRCACGGRIVAMPRGEVEKRRAERRG